MREIMLMSAEHIESIRERMCDNYCLWRFTLSDPDELEGKCEQCPLNELSEGGT